MQARCQLRDAFAISRAVGALDAGTACADPDDGLQALPCVRTVVEPLATAPLVNGADAAVLSLWHHAANIMVTRGSHMATNPAANEVAMLRAQIELLMTERENLLRTVGAASVFIANLDAETLPEAAWDAGDILAECLNDLPEDTLHDALELVRPLVVKDLENAKD
ncbi:MAG: hypothetical protein ABI794_06440 [Betaproteobacteria bacterium]